MEIDRREPNPIRDSKDITLYNDTIQAQRLYQLLMAIDDKFEAVRRDLLKKDPLPSPEMAYSATRREEARMGILKGGPSETIEGSSLGDGLQMKGKQDGRTPARSESSQRGGGG